MKKLFPILVILTLAWAAEPAIYSDLSLKQALAEAQSTDKAVLVKFHADWCHYCRAMDKNTFSDATVEEGLRDYIVIKVNVDTPSGILLARKYKVSGLPTLVALDSDGNITYRQSGYQSPQQLLAALQSRNG
ncbi:MAG: thioredoxin family protein [FCB group bacterium]|nr:thioredoxin family protein [FCB group bacterium]